MKAKYIILIVVVVLVVVAGLMFGLPLYNVWQQEMSGKAEMAKAEQNRKILVEEANARYEAAKLDAKAEIERAKGMAQAMEIENGKLTSTYNQYLFIRTLEKISDKGSLPQTIYIPTEGMLPVMNIAGQQKTPPAKPN
jgi:regulator of protease activity HflC (stomatin/prohibitin superfamily)